MVRKSDEFIRGIARRRGTRRFRIAGNLKHLTGGIEYCVLVIALSGNTPKDSGNQLAARRTIERVSGCLRGGFLSLFIERRFQH